MHYCQKDEKLNDCLPALCNLSKCLGLFTGPNGVPEVSPNVAGVPEKSTGSVCSILEVAVRFFDIEDALLKIWWSFMWANEELSFMWCLSSIEP